MNKIIIRDIIKNALSEDLGTGDITTNATIPENAESSGKFIAKESGIICGLDFVEQVFAELAQNLNHSSEFQFIAHKSDGEHAEKGEIIAEIRGKSRILLMGERVALNILQKTSGIASETAKAVAQVAGTNVRIVDTRKTSPGLRIIEKYAVKCGGGANHRFNLSDGILIKDNHIMAAGSIKNAITYAKLNAPHTLKIEVECETMAQVKEAVENGADIIMLDNMGLSDMSDCVKYIKNYSERIIIEASGNMDEKDLKQVAQTGIDVISIGALTRNAKSLDISLKFAQNQ